MFVQLTLVGTLVFLGVRVILRTAVSRRRRAVIRNAPVHHCVKFNTRAARPSTSIFGSSSSVESWRRYPVKTSHCQNVPQPKRLIVKTSPVKTSRFEAKRPRWSKRPRSKRTNASDLMQWLHSVTDCAVVIYTDRDSKFKKFLRSRNLGNHDFFRNLKSWFVKFLKFVEIRDL